jgi:AcrR family transcriptional regulator
MSSRRIADEIAARITSGQLKAGARVPSARQIMRKWRVANATASKALAILSDAGLVRAIAGVGTVVVEQGLSQAKIVQAGVAIADREGLAAVTIRRVASELGVSAMSLYRYFPSKDELVLLLVDAVFADESVPSTAPDCSMRQQLEAAARMEWQMYCKHPWLAGAISISRPQLLPNAMQHTEYVLRALDGRGLSDQTMLLACITLLSFVRGLAVNLEAEAQAEQETGLSRVGHLDRQHASFDALTSSSKLSTLGRMGSLPKPGIDLESLLEFGLARMLDGLEVLVASAADAASAKRPKR